MLLSCNRNHTSYILNEKETTRLCFLRKMTPTECKSALEVPLGFRVTLTIHTCSAWCISCWSSGAGGITPGCRDPRISSKAWGKKAHSTKLCTLLKSTTGIWAQERKDIQAIRWLRKMRSKGQCQMSAFGHFRLRNQWRPPQCFFNGYANHECTDQTDLPKSGDLAVMSPPFITPLCDTQEIEWPDPLDESNTHFCTLTACVWQIGALKSFSQVCIPELAGWVCSSCRTPGLSKAFSSVAETRCHVRSYFTEITLITVTTFSFVPKIHLWKP